jgi:hypothetical protein
LEDIPLDPKIRVVDKQAFPSVKHKKRFFYSNYEGVHVINRRLLPSTDKQIFLISEAAETWHQIQPAEAQV